MTKLDDVCREVQRMWTDPQLREAVQLSQVALFRRLRDAGIVVVDEMGLYELPPKGI